MHSSSSGLTAFPSSHSRSPLPFTSLTFFLFSSLARRSFAHFHQFGFQICECVCERVFVSLHLRLSVIQSSKCVAVVVVVVFAHMFIMRNDDLKHRGLYLPLSHFLLSLSTVVIVIILLFHLMILLGIFFSLFSFSLC